MSVLVIAEPGGTGEGDYEKMVRLLETAKACGADCFKPQFTVDAERHLERRARRLSEDEEAAFRARYARSYHWLQWPAAWHADFRDRCHELGMQYACSVCLPKDVAVAAPFVDYLKIASFEASDSAIVKACRQSGKPWIVSTGMSENGDVLKWLGATYMLHCVSAYPAPLEALNLSVLQEQWLEGASDFNGLSDHSKHVLTGAVAVACGAVAIEAHYRLDDCDPENPDYAVSFDPWAFGTYIQNIRDAERMLGDGVKRLQPCEVEMARYQVRG